jgi:hypothetical protein
MMIRIFEFFYFHVSWLKIGLFNFWTSMCEQKKMNAWCEPGVFVAYHHSLKTIKELIAQGERKTLEELASCESIKYQF